MTSLDEIVRGGAGAAARGEGAIDAKSERSDAAAVLGEMKIGFFIPWITKSRGGTENVGQMMANAMAKRGHSVQIFTFDDARAPSQWPLEPSIRLFHLPECDPPDESDLQLTMAVAQANVDLIVGLHMNRTFGRYVKCAHRLGLPIVVSEHIDPKFPQMTGSFTKEERLRYFSGATRIHLLAEAYRDSLPASFHDRVCVVPNTVPPARRLAEPGFDAGQKTIITVSRLVPRKRITQLIEAFALAFLVEPGWRLRVVGYGPELPKLKAAARRHNLVSAIEFSGHADDSYSAYEEAQIYCLASIFEGFPLTLVEAMAHGLPCLANFGCPGINAQISDGQTGILSGAKGSGGTFAEDLLRLMQDPDLRRRLGAAAHRRYVDNFSEAVVIRQWEEMFRSALTDRQMTPAPSERQRNEALLLAELETQSAQKL